MALAEPTTASTTAPAAVAPGTTGRPAGHAATRASVVALALGAAGLLTALLVVVRLVERWRVSGAAAHHVTLLGARLSYPVANVDAIALLVMAAIGAAVLGRAAAATAAELRAQRRLARWIAGRRPRPHPSGATVITDPRALAFTAGLARPRIYLTTSAVQRLAPPAALAAVIAHERQHAARRDPLRIAAGRVAARALTPLPGIVAAVAYADRLAELSADEAAAHADDAGRPGLAAAMLVLDGVDADRVDHLLGGSAEPPGWPIPALAALTAGGTLALATATVLLLARAALGQATLAPPFLSDQPCVVVLAAIPAAAVLLLAARLTRRSPGPGTPST